MRVNIKYFQSINILVLKHFFNTYIKCLYYFLSNEYKKLLKPLKNKITIVTLVSILL